MAVSDNVQPSNAAASSGLDFPEALGHYQFRARLGGGGQGEVYEAWDSKLQRSVAIKRIRHDGAANCEDLVREARMAASLRHTAFVKVHAIEEIDGSQFIVMELVPGRTLKQVLADGLPQINAAIVWMLQVAEAMRDAHTSGLVHGDLKPSNLMVEPDGKIRILDFGLALRQDMLATTTLTNVEPQGTIAYMAPERLLGELPDARGDIYALGVILYEIAVGSRPFATLNGLALAAAQVQSSSDSWKYPDHVETPLIALIRAMTARQPELRLPTMSEVITRLDELHVAERQLPPATPMTAKPSSGSRATVWKALQVGGIAILLALCTGFVWWKLPSNIEDLRDAMSSYSEAAEIEQGLAALKLYDRPGELENAEIHFNRVLRQNRENAAAVAGMSLVNNLRYMSDSKDEIWLQKADAGAQLALKINDQLALSQIATGAVYDRHGRFDDALKAYTRALRLDPSNYFAWYGKVETLRNSRRYPETLAALNEAMQRFPLESVFIGEFGVLKFDQGDYVAAEQAFRRSIALQPDAVTPYANLNAALLAQNRDDEALRVLQKGLQVRPSASLYSNLGTALFVRGDYVGAAQAFENAVSPTRGGTAYYVHWANLGDALLWLPGREQQAKHAYEKARQLLAPQLARSPNDPVMISRMGLYSARVGDASQALTLMQRALNMASQDANVQFRAGLTYELLGRRSTALAAINEAKRLGYPSNLIDAEPGLVELRREPGYRSN